MQNKKQLFLLLISILLFTACNNHTKSRLEFDISNLEPKTIEIKQYGNALFSCDTNHLLDELKRLQPEFSYFLGNDLDNPMNIKQIHDFVTDKHHIELYQKTKNVFPDLTSIGEQITSATRRFHYYFPAIPLPKYYTYISGVYFESPVLADNQCVVIGIDCYLGEKEEFYKQLGIPMYAVQRMTSEHLVNDVFKAMYISNFAKTTASKTILEEMIEAGKKLYFLEAMQPQLADNVIIGYSKTQNDWIEKHQGEVWAFLVSEQILYKNDYQMFKKLFGDGPFTQEFSEEAPARMGEWVGWKIVRNFMAKEPKTTLDQLMKLTDYQTILAESKYKPKS